MKCSLTVNNAGPLGRGGSSGGTIIRQRSTRMVTNIPGFSSVLTTTEQFPIGVMHLKVESASLIVTVFSVRLDSKQGVMRLKEGETSDETRHHL
jgi:hypothetical protein